MDGKRMWAARVLGGFFVMMAACTVISRAASSLLVAQVQAEKPGRGRLSYSYEGSGEVVPAEEQVTFLWPNQQIEWVAEQGKTVKAGECLVQFRMEYLQQEIEKKQAEVEQLRLAAEQQRVSAKEQQRVPVTAGASFTLEEARAQYAAAQQKLSAAQAAYEQFLQESPRQTAQNQNAGIGSAAAAGVNSMMSVGSGSISGGESSSAAAGGSGNSSSAGTGNDSNNRDGSSTSAGNGSISYGNGTAGNSTAGDAAERQARQQELQAAVQEAQAALEAARQTVTQAEHAYELAAREDAAQNANAAQAAQAAGLGVESQEVQVEQAEKELEKLLTYQNDGGKICAGQECVVLRTDVQAGVYTTGSEVLVTGYGGWKLKGEVAAEEKEKLKVGADIEVRLGTGTKKTTKIQSLDIWQGSGTNGEKENGGTADAAASGQGTPGFWYAPLPEHTEGNVQEKFSWNIENPSEREYEQIIPLGALREDMNGFYCLILEEEETMLGTVQTAKRVPVKVLEKDAAQAAVQSNLKDTDQVIASSEKYVEEGDRVRVKE